MANDHLVSILVCLVDHLADSGHVAAAVLHADDVGMFAKVDHNFNRNVNSEERKMS